MAELTDDEIDKLIKEEITPDILNDGSISKEVDNHLDEMGFLWDVVRDKLEGDKLCFECKKDIDLKTEKLQVIQAKTDRGVVAFVGLCEKCHKKALKNDDSKSSAKID